MKVLSKLTPQLTESRPYQPGRPIEDVAGELGLDAATIIKLASNESALGASPLAIAAVQGALADSYLYPDGATTRLRERIAAAQSLTPDEIIVGNGSNELLELVAHCFMRPDTSAVFSAHSFAVYKLLCQTFASRPLEVPMATGFVHDLDRMADAIQADTSVVFVCNPNNPTGSMVEAEKLRHFIESVPDDVLLVLDEAYAELAAKPLPDALSAVRRGANILVCRTFSKAYGLAGFRVGYGMAPAPLIRALHAARQPFNVNRLAQVAAEAALDDDDFIQRSRHLYQEERRFFAKQCDDMTLEFVEPTANFILIRVGDGGAVTDALTARGVIVRPMAGYGLSEYIRVTFGQRSDNERFFAALADVLNTSLS